MPRDSSGNYTFPAGIPFVTGTAISAATMNSVLSDLAAEVEDSLSRSGEGGMLVPFAFSDGTVSAPGVGFTNDTDTGMYRNSTGPELNFAVSGTERLSLTTTGADITGTLSATGALTVGSISASGGLAVNGNTAVTGSVTATTTVTGTLGLIGPNSIKACVQVDISGGGNAPRLGNSYGVSNTATWSTTDLTIPFSSGPSTIYYIPMAWIILSSAPAVVQVQTILSTTSITLRKYDMTGVATNWVVGDRVALIVLEP